MALNSWAPVASYPRNGSHLSVAVYGGYIYTAGGSAGGTPTNKTYRYDPASNSWDDNAIADLPIGLHAGAFGWYENRWVIAGGWVSGPASNQAMAWDPTGNNWVTLPNMPQGRYYAGGVGLADGFYSIGGLDSNVNNRAENQRYAQVPCDTPTPTPPTCPPDN